MDSIQKGFRRMRRVASSIASGQQIRQRNSTDPTRAMVVLDHHSNQTRVSFKTLQAAVKLLGTLFDEQA
jgi:hypothetical protein